MSSPAHAAGVKIDSIAGANLAFGDIEYSYFSIIKSALDTNSDGIIQLSSTTMGATGAAPRTEAARQLQARKERLYVR